MSFTYEALVWLGKQTAFKFHSYFKQAFKPFQENDPNFLNYLLRTHNIYNSQFTKLVITLTNNSINNKKLTKNLQIDTKILTSQCFHC